MITFKYLINFIPWIFPQPRKCYWYCSGDCGIMNVFWQSTLWKLVLSPLTFWLFALTLSKYCLYSMETDHKICEIFFYLSWLEKEKNKHFINSYSRMKCFIKHHLHKKMDWQNATVKIFCSNKLQIFVLVGISPVSRLP